MFLGRWCLYLYNLQVQRRKRLLITYCSFAVTSSVASRVCTAFKSF